MLTADATVLTPRGPQFVADLYGKGPTLVFTWNGERITLGKVEVFEARMGVPHAIGLDDETSISVSTETMVLLRTGAPRFLEQLKPGVSLLPLYTKLDRENYLTYQQVGDWRKKAKVRQDRNRWRRVSRMVAEWKLGRRCRPGDAVAFIDGNRLNCHPDNLRIEERTTKTPKQKHKFADPFFKAHEFITRNNHKVTHVSLDISADLFSIRGLGAANLAVNGIFISVDTE